VPALISVKTVNIYASDIVLVQVIAVFPVRLADALKVTSANVALSMSLNVLTHNNKKTPVKSRSDLVVPVLAYVPSLTCVPPLHFAAFLNDEKNVRIARHPGRTHTLAGLNERSRSA
jgi:hypothetical protein